MTLTTYPVYPGFAAELGDIDLSQPLAPAALREIKDALSTYGVIVFPEQKLTHDQHVGFAKQFGPIEMRIQNRRNDEKPRDREDISYASNVDPDGHIFSENSRQRMFRLGNKLWHTDSSFRHVPAFASMLYGRAIAPIGGHTQFADMRAAYDALSREDQNAIARLEVEHSIFASRAKIGFTNFSDQERADLPPVRQALVRTLPETARKTLYLAAHADRIIGMDLAEGRALLDRLTAHATRREFVYTHRWRTEDLVVWDNRCTMHRGTDFDDVRWKRNLQRATVSDVANTSALLNVGVEAESAALLR
jgi:alpha-ketoglutarate-dependent 2,4-dichlorophenoxyacetate dioxygenase